MATVEDIFKAVKITAELTGSAISDDAASVMLMQLKPYGADAVLSALMKCQRELKHRLTLADIIERIEQTDGRYTADEAWAKLPKDDNYGALVTNEMDEAAGFAWPLLQMGDKVAARMAFKDAYERIVSNARLLAQKPRWRVSAGVAGGNAEAAADGLRRGLLNAEQLHLCLKPDEVDYAMSMAGIQLALPAPTEKGKQYALEAKALLSNMMKERGNDE